MAAADREMHSPSQKMLTCNSGEEAAISDTPYSSTTVCKMAESRGILSFLRRASFQLLVLIAVTKLFVYMFKLFEDGQSTKEYYHSNDLNFAIISAACLGLPPLLYAIYLIGEHLTRSSSIDMGELATKLINGLLLWPWQIKRHLDVLHFAAQRVCQWRKPSEKESQDLSSIKRTAEILEFFEDIYAGFLQILLQTYLFFLSRPEALDTESPGIPAFRSSELLASTLCVVSMLIAVRRRDDGPLTSVLSMSGWCCIFTSRILSFTLGTVVLRGWICVFFAAHIIGITLWVYKIAIESYSIVRPNEPLAPGFIVTSPASPSAPPAGGDFETRGDHTATFIKRKPSFTAFLIFLFFGIPSLLIWPFMFQLREKKRPLIFLTIITLENVFLVSLYYFTSKMSDPFYPSATIVASVIGFALLSIYACVKPTLTDQVVLFNIREERANSNESSKTWIGSPTRSFNATKYGIYYEFCDLIFKLPSTHSVAAGMRDIQSVIE